MVGKVVLLLGYAFPVWYPGFLDCCWYSEMFEILLLKNNKNKKREKKHAKTKQLKLLN